MRTLLTLSLLLAACGDDAQPATQPTTPAPAPAPTPAPAPDPAGDEACAAIIVVSWQGAEHAPAGVTRTEADARARAQELLQRVERGEDFAAIARAESDAPSSRPRGGVMGTYTRSDWPAIHQALRDPVFALQVGQWSEVIAAPYGYVIAKRCAVEKIHTRHILVRYRGARNAGEDVTRPKEEASRLAAEIRAQVTAAGADFAAIARERSEDSSAARGGDLGLQGRGRLALAYEEAAFALEPNGISQVVESEFGYHVIQRLP